jgi:copper chaperone
MTSTTYYVTGMTCGHCVRAVAAEMSALGGVTEVRVDLVPGGASEVTVVSGRELDTAAVQAALDEAGDYRLGTLGNAPGGTPGDAPGGTPGDAPGEAPGEASGQGLVPGSRWAASRGPAGSPRELPIVE